MQKSRRGNGGGKAKAGKAMAGKGKWRGGTRLEARKNRYDQKAALRKSSYQHGSIVFGKITLMPYPALQLAERGKKRFFPLASKSLKLSVSAESAKNWREGEVVRARLLRVRERTDGYHNTHKNVQHSVRQSVQEGIQQGGRRQDLWQNPSQEARQGVKQGVTQGVTHNYSKHRFRTFAPILFAHPLESLGCFNGDIAFLCELGLRQHAAQRATDYMEIPRSPLSADEESTDEENLQVEAELEAIKPYVYSQEQKQQAQAGAAEPTREDLRELPFITIDGEDARDFDDAVMAEPIKPDTKNSNTKSSNTKNSDRAKFRLRIAIADVALYVKADSQLDKRARARGNSIYLPDRVVAMLPARLSENLCSLQPQRERPCLMVEIIIDARGRVLKQRVARVVIKSKARVTYEQVERILENKKHETEVEKLIENLYLAWMALAIARKERGALEINRSEPVPILKKTDSGRIDCTNIAERHNSNARRIIEDFMIAANVAIASHLNNSYLNKSQSKATKKKTSLKEINQGVNKGVKQEVKQEIKKELGFVIRNHEPPTLEKWQALQEELGRLKDACSSVPSLQSLRESGSQAQKTQGQKTQAQKMQAQKMQSLDSSDRLAEQRRQQLSALLQDVQAKTLQAKKSAKENAEQSPSPIFDYLPLLVAEVVLRAQSQARYATTNPQHFALALPNYCHFTSPIRRYADLLVHRAVLASLENKHAGESRKNALKISPELCEHLVACERSAIALERITFQRIACHYLKNRIGEVVEGVVLKVMPFGFFVRLRELPVEGIVARESLEHYRFQYANEKVLVGKRSISFGSRIKVEIHESDPIVARLELKLKE